jgi:uncharacterized protein (TIGR00369 family)
MYDKAACNEYYEPKITIARGRAEVTIPVRERFFHGAGAVHGAVYFKALDDAAFFAVNSLVEDALIATVSFNVYLVRPVTSGTIVARGCVVHSSKRLFIAESVVTDSDERELGRGSGSFMRGSVPLSAAIGYE